MKLHTILISAALTLLATGCDEATSRGSSTTIVEDAAGRGSVGKADIALEGLCAAEGEELACGGPAPVGNCWCDEACEQYGDCCVDAFDACGVGEPQPAVSQCMADAHCDEGQQCAGGVCIEVDASVDCDDDSTLSPLCDIKPGCDDGQVAARLNGCFECVDAVTCEPPQTEPVDCNDGSNLSPFCDIKPVCEAGEVAAIIGACFQCVDAVTCE